MQLTRPWLCAWDYKDSRGKEWRTSSRSCSGLPQQVSQASRDPFKPNFGVSQLWAREHRYQACWKKREREEPGRCAEAKCQKEASGSGEEVGDSVRYRKKEPRRQRAEVRTTAHMLGACIGLVPPNPGHWVFLSPLLRGHAQARHP